MTRWLDRIDLTDIWKNPDLEVEEQIQEIAMRMTAVANQWEDATLGYLVEELSDAAGDGNVEWFDEVWAEIYDWADANRVWIATVF